MAAGTYNRRMLSAQLECNFVVIERLTQRLNTIVTGHAIRAKGQEVVCRPGLSHL